MIVSEYFNQWLQDKKPDLQRSTYEAYTVYINKHIAPYFDEMGKPLEALKPLDIKRYVTEKRSGGRKDGKEGGLSAVSVRKHLNIIKQAFREAVLYEVIPSNPAEPVRLPKLESISDNAQFIPLENAQRILKTFQNHHLYPIILVTLIYGLRRSEVLGLRWSAVDFERQEMRICHTVVKNLTIEAKDRTKTNSSRRTFPLLPDVEEVLKPLYQREKASNSYIFAREDGSPLRPDSVTRGFQRVLERNNLPHMRFHDLRHATASILFDRGWSVPDVQHWLGHSDIETTMNIYVAYNRTRKLKVGGSLSGVFTVQ